MSKSFFENRYRHPLITPQELDQIYAAFERVNFPKGRVLLRIGEVAGEFSIIEEGLVRAFVYDYNGNDITTNFYLHNALAIEPTSLVNRIPSQECIETLTPCVCWRVGYNAAHHLFTTLPGYREWCFEWISQYAAAQQQRYLSMITHTATDRYRSLLDEKPYVLQHASLQQIASYLGINNATLSRIRKKIHQAG